MRFDILTIFPEFFATADGAGPLSCGLLGRAISGGLLRVVAHNLRDWADGPHRQVDDTPYGGGPGMVMKPEPIWRAVESLSNDGAGKPHVVLLSPQGRLFDHRRACQYAEFSRLLLICGRYEGVDHRISDHLADETISIGSYVLAGGEVAALAVIEAVARLVPGAVGNADSVRSESFVDGILDYPHYTRPPEFRGLKVPEELLSGDHARIDAWRHERAEELTRERRPDLLEKIAR